MSGRKGMPQYPESLKQTIREEQKKGSSVKSLSKKYGVSRYALQSWCGLRPEVEQRHATPRRKGRPRSNPENAEQTIKRLRMENELLLNFLSAVGRK